MVDNKRLNNFLIIPLNCMTDIFLIMSYYFFSAISSVNIQHELAEHNIHSLNNNKSIIFMNLSSVENPE